MWVSLGVVGAVVVVLGGLVLLRNNKSTKNNVVGLDLGGGTRPSESALPSVWERNTEGMPLEERVRLDFENHF